ncbi:nucleotide-diphospho-sugar transferase [Linderina pennispora]|uniref:Nucleotide-diphospho-sugar transferase n=1 Tax=Linderina pennispora TaxID=61395 RepID=A0A1Y1W8V5_9FUNG|nr:nucleotide-diphospho-sugar transferase [Linderina pennispora]ORX69961.1 nucleotide-diphospho-sugar transferase [Linderina pennispora]
MSAFATLLTTDSYLQGALVLAASLRATSTKHAIICLVADGQLSKSTLDRLAGAFDQVVPVPLLDTQDKRSLALLGRPDLGSTVTKLGVWGLTSYERIAFLDADTLVLQSIDELLDGPKEEEYRPNGGMRNQGLLAAAPDLGWPDCFNSGVFVAKPAEQTHKGLLDMLITQGSFDGNVLTCIIWRCATPSPKAMNIHPLPNEDAGGDQGLLNAYFADWSRADPTRRLPFAFNTTSTSFYTYAPAFRRFSDDVRVVHFIGPNKPWTWLRAANGSIDAGSATDNTELVEKWWSVHDQYVAEWSPEREAYDKWQAFSAEGYHQDISSEQTVDLSSSTSTGSHHMLDNAWKRNDRPPADIRVDASSTEWGRARPQGARATTGWQPSPINT